MIRVLLLLLVVFFVDFHVDAQLSMSLSQYKMTVPDASVRVEKLCGDSLQSVFLLQIQKDVPTHFHREHSENIYVLDGKARMQLGTEQILIRKGDFVNIPVGVIHAITEVTSRKPLLVLSIQAPAFDGSDRVIFNPK